MYKEVNFGNTISLSISSYLNSLSNPKATGHASGFSMGKGRSHCEGQAEPGTWLQAPEPRSDRRAPGGWFMDASVI